MSARQPRGNHSECCAGLVYPWMPHLHAEDCPARQDGTDPLLFREDRAERQQFEMSAELFKHPLQQVASALDTWGRMNKGGSFAQQCFIMANECLKAAASLSTDHGADAPDGEGEEPSSSSVAESGSSRAAPVKSDTHCKSEGRA